jgi:hypothetical protein
MISVKSCDILLKLLAGIGRRLLMADQLLAELVLHHHGLSVLEQ